MLFSASGNKLHCAVSLPYGLIHDIFWPFCIKNGPNEKKMCIYNAFSNTIFKLDKPSQQNL